MGKKKLIVILAIVILILILIAIRIVGIINKEKKVVTDFSTIKDLVEYDGHKYISEKTSTEEDFKKDIYINFNVEPITESGVTNQGSYEIVIKHIAEKILGNNFRIIDEQKNITIRIKFTDNEITMYTINGDNRYWKNLLSNYEINSSVEEKITNLEIKSQILLSAIRNNWEYDSINLGTKDSSSGNYDIYFDEGYKVRKINTKIYNIVFTKQYKDELIDKINTKMTKEQVETVLGKPNLISSTEDIVGYKGKEIYIFFGNDEISIYPVEKYNQVDNQKFAKLVTQLNSTGDTNTFLNKLTDFYSDYETYYKEDKYVNLIYPLKGFEITIGANQNNGVTIYSNYQGQVTEEISVTDIKKNKKAPTNINLKLTKNLVMQSEENRVYVDEINRNPYTGMDLVLTKEYSVIKSERLFAFYSVDKTQIDSELKIDNITNMLEYNPSTFIYGVKDEGIYKYDAKNMRLEQIYKGQGEFNLVKIENNTLYYDNKSLQL